MRCGLSYRNSMECKAHYNGGEMNRRVEDEIAIPDVFKLDIV